MKCRLDVQELLLGDSSLGVVLESVRVVLLDELQVCRLGQTQPLRVRSQNFLICRVAFADFRKHALSPPPLPPSLPHTPCSSRRASPLARHTLMSVADALRWTLRVSKGVRSRGGCGSALPVPLARIPPGVGPASAGRHSQITALARGARPFIP